MACFLRVYCVVLYTDLRLSGHSNSIAYWIDGLVLTFAWCVVRVGDSIVVIHIIKYRILSVVINIVYNLLFSEYILDCVLF
jgi:hypothetical protein